MSLEPAYRSSSVPAGVSGEWVVEIVDQPVRYGGEAEGADLRPACFHYRPGVYRLLRCVSTTFMTDLYDEWFTQRDAILEAWSRGGRVLMTGLGLGLVAEAMLDSPDSPVTTVTVVERSPDVLRLVGPHLRRRYGERIELIHEDAFHWQPPAEARYTVGWHDVWPDPYGARVEAEVARLEAHYAGVCDWQGSWPIYYRMAAGPEAEGSRGRDNT